MLLRDISLSYPLLIILFKNLFNNSYNSIFVNILSRLRYGCHYKVVLKSLPQVYHAWLQTKEVIVRYQTFFHDLKYKKRKIWIFSILVKISYKNYRHPKNVMKVFTLFSTSLSIEIVLLLLKFVNVSDIK